MGEPRITVAYTNGEDGSPGEILFYMNPEGRDLLVKELNRLDRQWDHLHLDDEAWTVELPLKMKAYVPNKEQLVSEVKMMLRFDEWDREYFPHVLDDPSP